jgi:hypothetical protein
MNARFTRVLALVALLPLAAACETSKSSNPLSPSVAGPIPGVDITPPTPLQPTVNANVESDQQPITLLIENASSNGQRPLTYRVEVAADAGFSTMVFSKDNIAPGGNGRTSVNLSDKLASDRTYFWRARAQDGANTGPFSAAVKFSVVTPVVIGAPTLVSPANGATVDQNPPHLIFNNAPVSGPAGAVSYLIQVATDQAFTQVVFTEQGGFGSNQTQVTPTASLVTSTTFYWRVRASAGDTTGPWSATGVFKVPALPVTGGGGDSGGGGSGGGGNGGGGSGGGSTGGCRAGSQGHQRGALDAVLAEQIVRGTADEYPCLTAVFNTDDEATNAAENLLRRMIWHLQQAGFGSARQKNPSGLISKDKLNINIGGQWHTYDVFRLGYAHVASEVTFNEVTPPNPQPDGGIPD